MLKDYKVGMKPERISNALVLDIDSVRGQLAVWRKKREPERALDVLTTFFLAKDTQIKDVYGYSRHLSNVKPGKKITIDYIKEKDGRFIALNVVATFKPQERR